MTSKVLIQQGMQMTYGGVGLMAGGALCVLAGFKATIIAGLMALAWAVACALSAALGRVREDETTGATRARKVV